MYTHSLPACISFFLCTSLSAVELLMDHGYCKQIQAQKFHLIRIKIILHAAYCIELQILE